MAISLKDYLKALEDCPDEQVDFSSQGVNQRIWQLTARLGIYNNWPVLLKTSYQQFLQFLRESDFTIQNKENPIKANYNPGTAKIQIFSEVKRGLVTYESSSLGHNRRQMENYEISLLLHPYQTKKIEGVNSIKAIALVANIIGKHALTDNIPLCFPRSFGWNDLKDKQLCLEKIVYYP